jgi:hypothetical protein
LARWLAWCLKSRNTNIASREALPYIRGRHIGGLQLGTRDATRNARSPGSRSHQPGSFVLFVMEVARPDERGIRCNVHVFVNVKTCHVSCCLNLNCGLTHA